MYNKPLINLYYDTISRDNTANKYLHKLTIKLAVKSTLKRESTYLKILGKLSNFFY